jgi:hypothetical protein
VLDVDLRHACKESQGGAGGDDNLSLSRPRV